MSTFATGKFFAVFMPIIVKPQELFINMINIKFIKKLEQSLKVGKYHAYKIPTKKNLWDSYISIVIL